MGGTQLKTFSRHLAGPRPQYNYYTWIDYRLFLSYYVINSTSGVYCAHIQVIRRAVYLKPHRQRSRIAFWVDNVRFTKTVLKILLPSVYPSSLFSAGRGSSKAYKTFNLGNTPTGHFYLDLNPTEKIPTTSDPKYTDVTIWTKYPTSFVLLF